MTERIYEDEFIQVDEFPSKQVVVVRRLPTRGGTEAIVASYQSVLTGRAGDPRYRDFGLILDLREAPGRNDDDFERSVEAVRHRAGTVFRKTVVLVATAAGRLQVQRLNREGRRTATVTDDMEEAMRLCEPTSAR